MRRGLGFYERGEIINQKKQGGGCRQKKEKRLEMDWSVQNYDIGATDLRFF